jgi:hypothetical protein
MHRGVDRIACGQPDRGDVRVRRRDGVALLLTREDRASTTAEGAVTAARALRNLLAHREPQTTLTSYPSKTELSSRRTSSVPSGFGGVGAVDTAAPHGQRMEGHGIVHADPELVEQLSSPVNDDFGVVPDPTGD